jgi:hypothetical protein
MSFAKQMEASLVQTITEMLVEDKSKKRTFDGMFGKSAGKEFWKTAKRDDKRWKGKGRASRKLRKSVKVV